MRKEEKEVIMASKKEGRRGLLYDKMVGSGQ